MLINALFLIWFLASLGAVGFIIYKKFPQLANLDVAVLPEEKFERKKYEIVTRRVRQNGMEFGKKIGGKLKPVDNFWRQIQLKFRIYVGKIERLMHHEEMAKNAKEILEMTQEERSEKITALLKSGNNNLVSKNFDLAEQDFISAIKLDSKLSEAYRGLGETYLAKGSIEEGKQTLDYVLYLEPDNDSIMARLAEIYEEQNDVEKAIEYYQRAVVVNDSLSPRFAHLAVLLLKLGQNEVAKEAACQAVELEPQNPKYLDLMVETAILCQDKKTAEDGFARLRLVNPENTKLLEFKDRINRI